MLNVLLNLPTPIFRPLRSSREDWQQCQKVGGPKLKKSEEVCVGFRKPFLTEKLSSTTQKDSLNFLIIPIRCYKFHTSTKMKATIVLSLLNGE